MSEPVWRVDLPDEAATRALAVELAGMVGAGDLVTLERRSGLGQDHVRPRHDPPPDRRS